MTKKNPLEKGGNLEQSTGDGAWERNNGGGEGQGQEKEEEDGKGRRDKRREAQS